MSVTQSAIHSKPPLVHGLIVAAGSGQRFGGNIAKQYTKVANKSVLEHSVEKLAASQYISEITIVVAADDELIHEQIFPLVVKLTEGGAERWQSVLSGVMSIQESGAHEQDLVLIHDAARPCISKEYIDEVIEAAIHEPYGAILGTPVTDTLKRVTEVKRNQSSIDKHNLSAHSQSDNINTIIETVDRQSLWQAQTPQVFRLGILIEVLNHIAEHQLTITDEASAFEALDYSIRIVKGDRLNMKLTYPSDLALLEAILAI